MTIFLSAFWKTGQSFSFCTNDAHKKTQICRFAYAVDVKATKMMLFIIQSTSAINQIEWLYLCDWLTATHYLPAQIHELVRYPR